jgi:flagellar motor protein MotB
MRRLNEFITEDTNQFGPGTDLTISLVAILMVMVLITSNMYQLQRKKSIAQQAKIDAYEKGGHFRLSQEFFPAGDFEIKPVTQLVDQHQTQEKVGKIIAEYRAAAQEFPFIFVVGHSNEIDDPDAEDKGYEARLKRNWEYAGRRAVLIAELLQEQLTAEQKEKIVVTTTGEFDLKLPSDPYSPDNAWVEVVFGKEWKRPSHISGPGEVAAATTPKK